VALRQQEHPLDFSFALDCGGSACAELTFDDDSTEKFGWYHDELTFTAEDFLGKTMKEIKRMHYERDLAYLRNEAS